jgi:hypothetical protein
MKLIESKTLGTNQASIEFTAIPDTFTDLVAVCSLRTTRTAAAFDNAKIRLNGTTTGYSERNLLGNGSSASSQSGSGNAFDFLNYTATNGGTSNTFGNSIVYIPNYTGSTNKSVSVDAVSENNGTQSAQAIGAGLWSNTAVITSITFLGGVNEFTADLVAGSTVSLYGIGGPGDANAPKATGGNVQKIGDYWVHTFTASGTFTPLSNINVEYLVIGGGGGSTGGLNLINFGAGGAAGVARAGTTALTTSTNYTVTIGAGGAGVGDTTSNPGSSSVFGSITATGGQSFLSSSRTGGSNADFTGGTTTVDFDSGGGAGAGANGSGKTGGAGFTSSISGSSVIRGGGGGGGSGGAGGAGGGGNANSGQGQVNTGSGGAGGGNSQSAPQGNGGSGIVIVRYLA